MTVYVVIEYGLKEPIATVFANKEDAEKFALRISNRPYTIDECVVR